jgi:hypothetical protein
MLINEFIEYYYEIIYLLEKSGEMQEGAYDKTRGVDNSANRLLAFARGLK